MKKSQLEIYAINDFPDLEVNDLDKKELSLKGASYERMCECRTPYVRLSKKEGKFEKKMNKIITDIGEKTNADMAMIKWTNTYYPDSKANHDIVFYKKK